MPNRTDACLFISSRLIIFSVATLLLAPGTFAQQRETAGTSDAVPPGYEHPGVERPVHYSIDPATGIPELTPEGRAAVERFAATRPRTRVAPRPRGAARRAPKPPEQRGGPVVFTVDSAYDDDPDIDGDGTCAGPVTGECQLRSAINEANAQPDNQQVIIEFAISTGPDVALGVWQIILDYDGDGDGDADALPLVSQPDIVVDGLTQSGASCGDLVAGVKHDLRVILDGSNTAFGFGIFANFSGTRVVRGLVVQNFAGTGLWLNGGLAECNYVGTDYTGEFARGNFDGIVADTVRNNLASGNATNGVYLPPGTSLAERNLAGTDADGLQPLGNGEAGILATGTNVVLDNVVSGNVAEGILLSKLSSSGGVGAEVRGNVVGLTRLGGALGNGTHGIRLDTVTDPVIYENTIGANGGDGIRFQDVYAFYDGPTTGALIEYNQVGTDASGTEARPNAFAGIALIDATDATVQYNDISANMLAGVYLGNGTSGHTLSENRIGTDLSGDLRLGNGTGGLFCQDGQDVRFENNTAAYNGGAGVFVNTACQRIALYGNSIYASAEIGIDLAPAGVTPNDPGDGDTGANGLTNFPVITGVTYDGSLTTVSWTLDALPNTEYQVEFCAFASPDPSGYGECRTPIGLYFGVTDGVGSVSDTATFSGLPPSAWIAATATIVDLSQPTGFRGTSEFSAAVRAESPEPFDLAAEALTPLIVPRGGSIDFEFTATNNTESAASGDVFFAAKRGGNTLASGVILSGTLQPGQSVTSGFTQQVPQGAPTGGYTYEIRLGQFPALALDTETFAVTVTSSAREGGPEAWAVTDVGPWLPDGAAVEALSLALPTSVALAAYPNPFAGRATLAYDLPETADVQLVVYDVLGRAVVRLVDGRIEPGRHEVGLDGSSLPSGVYLVRLEAGGVVQTQRLTLLR